MESILIHPLKVPASRIGLGTWAIGGLMWGGNDDKESIKTVLTALAHGINLIDTAPVYGFGVSEQIVGKAIKQHGQREKIIIATKVGLAWQNGKIYRDSSPAQLKREIETSLKNLQTDYIDIYQIHWPDPLVPYHEVATVMNDFFTQGKIRAIGVSNFSPSAMKTFMEVAPIHISQPPYNLFEREIEADILPFTIKENIVTLAYGALCRGLLSGKMRASTQFTGDDIRKVDPKFNKPHFEKYLQAVSALQSYAKERFNKSVKALAVRWILDQHESIIPLWGARHPEQIESVDEVSGWKIDNAAMKEINALVKQQVTEGIAPSFMAPPARKTIYD